MKLLIDTDTASDDAVALLLASVSGLAEVIAVTTVAGNVGLDQCTRNALYTLELAGATRVPVYAGCGRPLLRDHESAAHVHGEDGMGETRLPPAKRPAESGHAVDAILRIAAKEPPGTVTLVTLGPLTNIAAALFRDRGLLGRFRQVYCMAGAADYVGNVTATAEFNVWADPEAAAVVLAESDPAHVTWVGWDVSRQDAMMTAVDQERLRSVGTPLALFADAISHVVRNWAERVGGVADYSLPDPITMAVALDPGLVVESELAHVGISLESQTRGQLIIDRRPGGLAPNVTLVRRVDGPGFRSMLFGAFADGAQAPARGLPRLPEDADS